MTVKQVWIVRHGQTDWNIQRRWQGHIPTSLNAIGLEQAKRLGEYLREQPIDKIYSSDLPRAYETAQAIARFHNLDPIPEVRLREINVGIFQGLYPDEIDTMLPEHISAWRSGDMDYTPPCGESRRQLQTRACEAFNEITQNSSDDIIMLVSHGGTIRMMLKKICAEDSALEEKIPVPNASYTILERTQIGWRIAELTATPHLDDRVQGGNTGESSL